FAEPVDTKEVPEYLTVISEPMDFRTMREKVRMRVYKSVSALERDFRLVIANCRQFNPPDSIFVREATKL
ncbi:Bromodomain-containing protein, partial [Blastocladiella britannica]